MCYFVMEALLRQRMQQPSAERPDTMRATLRGAPLEHSRVHGGVRSSSSSNRCNESTVSSCSALATLFTRPSVGQQSWLPSADSSVVQLRRHACNLVSRPLSQYHKQPCMLDVMTSAFQHLTACLVPCDAAEASYRWLTWPPRRGRRQQRQPSGGM